MAVALLSHSATGSVCPGVDVHVEPGFVAMEAGQDGYPRQTAAHAALKLLKAVLIAELHSDTALWQASNIVAALPSP